MKSSHPANPQQPKSIEQVTPVEELQFFQSQFQDWMKQWALDEALKQRYQLIMVEIERRKAFYQALDNIKRARIVISMFMIFFLVYIVYWSFSRDWQKTKKEVLKKNMELRNKLEKEQEATEEHKRLL